MTLLIVFLVLIFLHSLVSGRLERTILTAPISFALAGMLAYRFLPGAGIHAGQHGLFLTVAELGLVLLLFTDASRTDLRVLKSIRELPVRLLSVGMVLTIVLGAVAAFWVFPDLTILEAGILAAILAPTDAGLGQIIVNSPRVPLKIRQALNVEAGLNDGLSVPFLLFFIALAVSGAGGDEPLFVQFLVEQLGYGLVLGGGVGLAGGWLMGLAVQIGFREAAHHSVEFAEGSGQLFNLSVFFLFGFLVPRAWPDFSATHALYALLSLTIVRMLPVAIALIRTRLSRATVLFVGWFGPRGLASIVLGLVFLEQEAHLGGQSTIRSAVIVTVLGSIFAHGLTAQPGMAIYARKVDALPAGAPEFSGGTNGPPPGQRGESRQHPR